MQCSSVQWLKNGVVRLPLQALGAIRMRLQLNTADVIEFAGSAVRIEATADARYVEDLAADRRPQDPDWPPNSKRRVDTTRSRSIRNNLQPTLHPGRSIHKDYV
jgi:hypothetical protein